MSRRPVRTFFVAIIVPVTVALSGAQASAQENDAGLEAAADQPVLTDRVDANKSQTSKLARSDKKLLGRTDSAPVRVMIKLDHDSLAAYSGGVGGLAATSPSVTGKSLSTKTDAQRKYEKYAVARENAFKAALTNAVPQADIGQSYRVVYGGISAVVPANRVDDIAAMDGVVAVQKDALNKLLTDSSPEFLGAPTVYNQLGGAADAGKGVIYGNLDSGVWPEHPSFADPGSLPAPPGPARECDFGDNPLTPANDPFACQDKLIGGAAFLDTYNAVIGGELFTTARDSNGHGTHTASTSAGVQVDDVSVLGIDRAPIHGLAPAAHVMEYKVCGVQGCFSSDSAQAVAQAILDGVDVINFSISGGTNPFTDPVELAFLDAYAAGVYVSASAGNDGPTAGTANHLSPWVATVGASTQRREFASSLTITADNGETFQVDGASITDGAGPLPIVLASDAPYSNALCTTPAPAGTFTGKIVACQRGPNRALKGFNVAAGGAAGMVLYNVPDADRLTDTHYLPTVHVNSGAQLVAFLNGHAGEVAEFTAGVSRDGQGDAMATFSSRGPAGSFLKPDITAPGVQIMAGDTPIEETQGVSGPPGEYFQSIAGTSMSSPHNAGAAILLKALHPDWTPGQIKSALMTTARQDVTKQDGVTKADPFDLGAGRIQLQTSGKPGLTFDESASNMAQLGNDPLNAVHLNIPSVNAPVMPGKITTVRTAKNVSGAKVKWMAETTAPSGSSISVSPKSVTLDPGQSVDLTITIASTAPPAQYFGEVRLVPNKADLPKLHLPVAFKNGQTGVTLASSCSPTQIALNATSDCQVTATNTTFADTTVDLTTKLNKQLKVVSAAGATVVDSRTVAKSDVPLAGNKPGVPSADPGELFGYIPLSSFGIAPTPIGDEQIINFNVPSYVYNGVTYSRLGIDSNGYLIAGGGTSQDNECCNLPAGADPARPNNMLAPLWTDLTGAGSEGVRIATLTDGVNTWLVTEYQVRVFDTNAPVTFQVWIGVDGTQDITYAYDPGQLPGAPGSQPFLVGAENTLGQGDMTATVPTTDQRITSTTPIPGASAGYTLKVRGVETGPGVVTTEMTGAGLLGTTVVTSDIAVGGG